MSQCTGVVESGVVRSDPSLPPDQQEDKGQQQGSSMITRKDTLQAAANSQQPQTLQSVWQGINSGKIISSSSDRSGAACLLEKSKKHLSSLDSANMYDSMSAAAAGDECGKQQSPSPLSSKHFLPPIACPRQEGERLNTSLPPYLPKQEKVYGNKVGKIQTDLCLFCPLSLCFLYTLTASLFAQCAPCTHHAQLTINLSPSESKHLPAQGKKSSTKKPFLHSLLGSMVRLGSVLCVPVACTLTAAQ